MYRAEKLGEGTKKVILNLRRQVSHSNTEKMHTFRLLLGGFPTQVTHWPFHSVLNQDYLTPKLLFKIETNLVTNDQVFKV